MSAFFSGSEAALFSLSEIKRKKLVEVETKTARILAGFWKNPSHILSSIILANECTNIVSTSFVTSTIISICGKKWSGIAIFPMAALLLVFGEVTPKTVAVCRAEKWAQVCAYPLYLLSKVTFPLYFSLQWIANKVLNLLKLPTAQKTEFYTGSELKTLLSISSVEGVLEQEEQEMIENVIDFYSTQVKEIMTPRTEIFAFRVEEKIPHILSMVKKTPYSRIPIYDKTLDNIEGILYSRDLLLKKVAGPVEDKELKEMLHSVFFVPITQKIDELLKSFRKKKVHIAIVVDEYGGTAGLITLEDILEEIFGEIIDEHDSEEKMVNQIKNRIYVVSSLMALDDFNKRFETELPLSGASSLGGFLLNAFGYVPRRGERIKYDNMEFIIRRSKATRITHVLVRFFN